MPVFDSPYTIPDGVPRDVSIWHYLFDPTHLSYCHRPTHSTSTTSFIDGTTGESLTYDQVRSHCETVSTVLATDYGMGRGDVACLFGRNTLWYPIALWSTLRVGGVISGASPAYTVGEMTYALKTAGAKFIFTTPESLPVALEAASAAGVAKDHIFLLEGSGQGTSHLTVEGLIKKGEGRKIVGPWTIPKGSSNDKELGFLSFSSGTTGLPKGVMISHGNVIGQSRQMRFMNKTVEGESVVGCLPLFHITGLVQLLHVPVQDSFPVVMMPSFEMKSFLDIVTKYKVTNLMLVPPIMIRLARDPIVNRYDLSFVKRFQSGAAPLSEEIISIFRKRWPKAGLWQGYGMTETTSCVTSVPTWHQLPPTPADGSVGHLCPDTSIKIISEDGQELGHDQPGELWVRGPQVVMGYLNNEKANRETWVDGWMRTGDQAEISSQGGWVFIRDRIKDMIKVKGVAVAPAELEDLLLGHPLVEDCAVTGVPDDYAGELPRAFIRLTSSAASSSTPSDHERTLIKYVEEKKSRPKHLRGGVIFVDEIPKSASGKILKRVLRDKYADVPVKQRVEEGVAEKAKL
ncbi:hypothetical protein YB2330_000837 [Saitoella coloradoensis]